MEEDTSLQRFLDAQETSYSQAIAELTLGKKQSHWIWYILPQLQGLGHSRMSVQFGIRGRVEAETYITHPVLRERLINCVKAMLKNSDKSALDILGEIDAEKFRSCLTLFHAVAPHHSCFRKALDQFYDGNLDARTLELLNPPT